MKDLSKGKRSSVRVDETKVRKDANNKIGNKIDDFFNAVDEGEEVFDETASDYDVDGEDSPITSAARGGAKINPRFSLPGAAKINNNKELAPTSAIRDVRANLKKPSFSPSDLSTVSTAPPTPAASATDSGAEDDQMNVVTQDVAYNGRQRDENESQEITTADNATGPSQEDENPEEDENHEGLPEDENLESLPEDTKEEEQEVNVSAGIGSPEIIRGNENQDETFPDNANDDVDNTPRQSDGGFPSPGGGDFDDNDSEGGGFELAGSQETPTLDRNEIGVANNDEFAEELDRDVSNETEPSEDLEDEEEHGSNASKKRGNATDTRASGADVESDEGASNLVHDPETPDSVRDERARVEAEEIARERKKKKATKKKKGAQKYDSQDSVTPESAVTSRKRKKQVTIQPSPKGYPIGNRGYSHVPLSDFEPEPGSENVRRSKRPRTKPLQYWKNERLLYGANDETGILGEAMGNMPVVNEVVLANPTPHKKRTVSVNTKKGEKKGKNQPAAKKIDESEKPFDARKLKKKYNYSEGESAFVWNDGRGDASEEKVISYSSNLDRHPLPLPATRKKSEGNIVGAAAQAFNIRNDDNSDKYVGYIMGHLSLPPKAIKDYESVGPCAQTFTVCGGQPKSLEVSYADPDDEERMYNAESAQRYLLSPGDMFRIPQNNTYQLQNHSTTTECLLTWTIIRPHTGASNS